MFKKLFVAAIIAIASITSYAQTLKIGTVNLDEVMQAMPETSVLEKELADRTTKFQTQAKSMQDEFQTKYQAYVEQADSLDELTRGVREDELRSLQQRADQYQQSAYQQITQYREQQLGMIQEKLFKAVKAVGDREKFLAVFPTNDATYFSASQTTDVTGLVKAELGIK